MSRGPGRIERAIRVLFDANPDLAFVTDELAEHCYPDAKAIERKHQVSVLRAAQKVIASDPDWEAWRSERHGRQRIFVNRANVESYAQGRLIAERYRDDYVSRAYSAALEGDVIRITTSKRTINRLALAEGLENERRQGTLETRRGRPM